MKRSISRMTPLAIAAGLVIGSALPAAAQNQRQDTAQDRTRMQDRQQMQNQSPNPYGQPDDSWITIDGTVGSVTADEFTLRYGTGTIIVEMDDLDRDADAYLLQQGDTVTVTGRIDDDLFETRTIEASTVYVQNLATYFYASALDEEDFVVLQPVGEPLTVVRGTVTSVGDEEFTIDRGMREVTVEVDELAQNPLDAEGYQRIEPGDYVSVIGEVDYDLFEGRELVAMTVMTLWDSSRDRAQTRTNLSADSIQGGTTQPDTTGADQPRSGDPQPE